jgi:Leucine-rich repeat (LRR) protein
METKAMTPWRQTTLLSVRLMVGAILSTIFLNVGCQKYKANVSAESKAALTSENNPGESQPHAGASSKPAANGNLEIASGDGPGQATPEEQRAVAAIEAAGGTFERDQEDPGKPIIRVDLSFKVITDLDLGSLINLKQLQELYLINTKITDRGLTPLATCSHLRILDIAGTQVTDAVLPALTKLAELKTLGLSNTKITDAGILQLKALGKLRLLDLTSCKAVSSTGVQQLQKALPEVEILH